MFQSESRTPELLLVDESPANCRIYSLVLVKLLPLLKRLKKKVQGYRRGRAKDDTGPVLLNQHVVHAFKGRPWWCISALITMNYPGTVGEAVNSSRDVLLAADISLLKLLELWTTQNCLLGTLYVNIIIVTAADILMVWYRVRRLHPLPWTHPIRLVEDQSTNPTQAIRAA